MTIQDLINATPLGGICDLGGQTYYLPNGTSLKIPYGMTIRNGTVTISDNLVPTCNLFDAYALQGDFRHRLEFRDLTINGPDTTGWASNTENPHGAIGWSYYKTWNSTLIVDNVTITGGYGTGVLRSGGGRLDIINSRLSGWVDAIAFFEGHGGYGSMLVRDSVLSAPANSKYDSIGAYVHPHLHVTMERVQGNKWNRFLLYLNGNPQSAGNHDLVDVVATDCSLIQTGSSSETTLIRCTEQGIPQNGGSFFKGPVLSVGSKWNLKGTIGLLPNNNVTRRFVGDTISPNILSWLAAGSGTMGNVILDNCVFSFDGKDQVVKITNNSILAVKCVSCTSTGISTGFTFRAEGGSLKFIDCQPFSNTVAISPGVIL